MDKLDRSTLKLMHLAYSGHGGVKSKLEVESPRKVVNTFWGDMCIGTTGEQSPVMDVIREVTGATLEDTEGCRDDTLFTFLFDMCRKQTRGATISEIKDKNFDIKQEL